jgi:hypothetical protein
MPHYVHILDGRNQSWPSIPPGEVIRRSLPPRLPSAAEHPVQGHEVGLARKLGDCVLIGARLMSRRCHARTNRVIAAACGSDATFIWKEIREMPPGASLCRRILSSTSYGLPISTAPEAPRCVSKLARVIAGHPRSFPTSVIALAKPGKKVSAASCVAWPHSRAGGRRAGVGVGPLNAPVAYRFLDRGQSAAQSGAARRQ